MYLCLDFLNSSTGVQICVDTDVTITVRSKAVLPLISCLSRDGKRWLLPNNHPERNKEW